MSSAIRRLAVATLSECGSAAAARFLPHRPLQGYCLVSGETENCRVTLFMQNGRMGTSYAGWGITEAGEESLGPFQMSSEGDGGFSDDRPVVGIERYCGIRVTAQGLGPVLEGKLVWLVGQGRPAALPDSLACQLPENAMKESTRPDLPVSDPGDEAADLAVVATAPPIPNVESFPPPEPPLECEPEPLPEDVPSPALRHEDVIIDRFRRTCDPANPVSTQASDPQRVSLRPAHPHAGRAAGTVQLNTRSGGLLLSVRGLPSPTQFGQDPATGRPCNGYRVWLVNQRTKASHAVGLCTRAWGDNFRLQVEGGLDLKAHDLIVVTAADRAGEADAVTGPRLLSGSFEHR